MRTRFSLHYGLLGTLLKILLSFVTFTPKAYANSIVPVKSSDGSSTIYEIVYSSESTDTKLPPGIYTADDEPKIILRGTVLGAGKKATGILGVLQATDTTGRDEVLLVVDGKLTLITSKTRATSSDSFIVFGSKKNPVVDAMTGQTINIPDITSLENVSIIQSEVESVAAIGEGIQNVLVSLKTGPKGSTEGLTFGFSMKRVEKPNSPKVELTTRPLYFDNRFLTKTELRRLMPDQYDSDSDKRHDIIARLPIYSLTRPNSEDTPIIQIWKKDTRHFADTIHTGKKTTDINDIPRLSLLTGQVVTWEPSHYDYEVKNFPEELTMEIDPVKNQTKTFVGIDPNDDENAQPDFSGSIEFDEKQGYRAFQSTDEEGRVVTLFGTQTGYLIGLKNESTERYQYFNIGDIGLQGRSPTLVSITHVFQDNTAYVFISRKSVTSYGLTTVYVIEQVGSSRRLGYSYDVYRQYLTTKELKSRVKVHTGDEDGDGDSNSANAILFDSNNTEAQATAVNKSTLPFINVTQTTSPNKIVQTYLKSLADVEIVQGHLNYREFNPKNANSIQTGFYIRGGQFIPGKLITKAIKTKKKSRTFFKEIFTLEGSTENNFPPKVSMAIFPIEGGGGSFQLGTLFYDQNPKFQDHLYSIAQNFGFHRIKAIKVVQHLRERSDHISLLLFVADDPAEGAIKGVGGVLAVTMRLRTQYEGEITTMRTVDSNSHWLTKEQTQPEHLQHRLLTDKSGALFWVVSHDKSPADRHFQVVRMTDFEKVYPNTAEQRVKLRAGEFKDENFGSKSDFFGGFSMWSLNGKFDIRRRFPWMTTYFSNLEKSDKREAARKLEKTTNFTGLREYLEQIAQKAPTQAREIIFVDPSMKHDFLQEIMVRAASNRDGRFSVVSAQSREFYIHYFQDSTVREVDQEIQVLASQSDRHRILVVDLNDVNTADGSPSEEVASRKPAEPATEVDNKNKEEEQGEEEGEEEETDEGEDVAGEEKEDATEDDPQGEVVSSDSLHEDEQEDEDEIKDRSRSGSPLFHLATEGQFSSVRSFKIDPTKVHKYPVYVIATPDEWRTYQGNHSDEFRTGFASLFQPNYKFMTSSWTVWSPKSSRARKDIKSYNKSPIAVDKQKVFPNLGEMLVAAATPGDPPKHKIIIVPDDLKPLVQELIWSRWATDEKSLSAGWNYKNKDLSVFNINNIGPKDGSLLTQEMVFDNLAAIRGMSNQKRSVLLGSLEDVLRIGRVKAEDETMEVRLKDPAEKSREISSQAEDAKSGGILPHLLWLLSTEGQQKGNRNGIVNPALEVAPPSVPIFLFGSEKEWNAIRQEIGFESRFALDSRFERVELNAPTFEIRRDLVRGLFDQREISNLQIQFVGNAQGQDRDDLIAFLVRRVEQNCATFRMDPTSGFVRTFSELRRSLIEDAELRQKKIIDRNYLERLLTKVFPLPLGVGALPDGDFLRKLQNPEKAALQLQQLGYEGPLELKSRFVSRVFSQTRGSDASKPIPSSVILFGGTSTGKTYLVQTLWNFLGLKQYDFDKPNDLNVNAFMINMATITEREDKAHPELMTVEQLINHLSNFLSLPQGYRGFILFDDLHKATSAQVMKTVMTYLQSLFEAKGGIFKVVRMDTKELKEIPVRNLTIMATVNPQSDKKIVEQFGGERGNLTADVIAALVKGSYSLEESTFARWSDIINLDEFPREAKTPSVVKRVRAANKQEFSTNPKVVLVSPDILRRVVAEFPEANSREFLSTATYSLLTIRPDMPEAPIYLVRAKPKDQVDMVDDDLDKNNPFGADGVRIENYIKANTIVRPVIENDYDSQVMFVNFLVQNFRTQLLESVLQGSQQHPVLAGSYDFRRDYLAPFILSILSNLKRGNIPLQFLNMSAKDFGATNESQLAAFDQAVDRMQRKELDGDFFPIKYDRAENKDLPSLKDFLGHQTQSVMPRSRVDVMADTTQEIYKALRPIMAHYVRVDNLSHMPSAEDWVESMPDDVASSEENLKRDFATFHRTLFDIFNRFNSSLYDPDLVEMNRTKTYVDPSNYDRSQLFLLCLDRAIGYLPWGQLTHFLSTSMARIFKNLSLVQKTGFQAFLFDHHLSPLNASTPDFMQQVANSSEAYNKLSDEFKLKAPQSFELNCRKMFSEKN